MRYASQGLVQVEGMRDILFVSHANPEDNAFAEWLALQLAVAGYPVWCDLTRLLGGEDFWNDIEVAIRTRSIKFLFVLSRTSNTKQGALKELQVAENVARDDKLDRFILPLAIDDLPPRQANIALTRLTSLSFSPSWARGLAQLLKRLEEDGVPKAPQFGPETVTKWWRTRFSSSMGVRSQPEQLVSNWFPILSPVRLHFHTVRYRPSPAVGVGPIELPTALPWHCVSKDPYLVSFAPASALDGHLGPCVSIQRSEVLELDEAAAPARRKYWTEDEERAGLVELLSAAWDQMVRTKGLSTYAFSNRGRAFYFVDGTSSENRVTFRALDDGSARYRQVVGFKTVQKATPGQGPRLRYWHFALEARPILSPSLGFAIKPHLLFSDDGRVLWSSKERMHKAGRSQRRNWWNDDWRDRIIGSMAWLAEGDEKISLPTSAGDAIPVSRLPLQFECPLSFDEDDLEGPPLEEDFVDTEDDEADDSEELV